MPEISNLHRPIFLTENIHFVNSVRFQTLWVNVNISLSEDAQIAQVTPV